MTTLAPICLFTYNRLTETKQTVEALKNNFLASQSQLFIFSDGPKNNDAKIKVNEVREFIKSINGFKKITVFESKTNKGLANSIIEGVSKVITEYGKVIVLEDDLLTTPNFLDFMNCSLNFYENNFKIMSVNGFSLKLNSAEFIKEDVFFMNRTYSWGWGTWKDEWFLCDFNKDNILKLLNTNSNKLFKDNFGNDILRMLKASLNGVNDSWYVRWVFSHFINSKISVYPINSKVSNIGYGENATHCTTIDVLESTMDETHSTDFIFPEEEIVFKNLTCDFLNYFTLKYKIYFRLMLLKNSNGRSLIIKDIKEKIFSRLKKNTILNN